MFFRYKIVRSDWLGQCQLQIGNNLIAISKIKIRLILPRNVNESKKNNRDCLAIKSSKSNSQHYVALKRAFFIQNLLTSKSIKGELHAQLFHACCTIDILTFCLFLHLSATGSRVHSNMTTVVEYHFRVCKIR